MLRMMSSPSSSNSLLSLRYVAEGATLVLAAASVAINIALARKCSRLAVSLQELDERRRKLADIKQAERSGRIEAEKELRKLRTTLLSFQAAAENDGEEEGEDEDEARDVAEGADGDLKTKKIKQKKEKKKLEGYYPFAPIGYIRTCFTRRSGTPRQPHLVPAAKGVLVLKTELPKDILSGLSDYSHCWVIYVFHQNTNLGQEGWAKVKGKVQVPRLNGGRVGVLATRSPHRPNAIGLSSARIDSVSGKVLTLSGVDLVDGSPVLDVKPYLPFCDDISGAETPEWVQKDRAVEHEPLHIAQVLIPEEAKGKLFACWSKLAVEAKQYHDLYTSFDSFLALVDQVLGRDIRSVYQRTKQQLVVLSPFSSDHHTGRDYVYHLHLLQKIDVSYVHDKKQIEIIDACIV
mmetsp:Transcript_5385/g.9703  ORF Transcript_5385/g.9703 Transcript_5385/m.9703 type:complete len:404 (-) Transcript_5385:7-1218(-)